jgi:hypothetical protein
LVAISGAVRLRSLGDDDVITFRVVDALVVTVLVVVIEEEQVTDRVGEFGFFWKRLMMKIISFIDSKKKNFSILTQDALFDVHYLVIILCLEYFECI